MPGQPRCWQCGASLPPPEAAFAPPPPAVSARAEVPAEYSRPVPVTSAYPSAHPAYTAGSRGLRSLYLYAGLFVVTVLILLLYVGFYARTRQQAVAVDRGAQEMIDAQERMMRELNRMNTGQRAQVQPGSEEEQAQRMIKRLQDQAGLDNQPPGSGDVRLLHGGTISREQWEKARKSLQNR